MNLQPLLDASLAIQIHFYTVVPAFILGTLQFALPKGTTVHRYTGYLYMALMMVTATAALFIPSFMGGHFGFIHLFVILTYCSVPYGLYHARIGNITSHRNAMIGLYLGGLIVAGGFAFMPGRIMHAMLFG